MFEEKTLTGSYFGSSRPRDDVPRLLSLYRAGRLKQWLNYLRRRHPQAELAYAAVRTINDPTLVAERLGLPRTVAEAADGEQQLLLEEVT